MACKQTSNIVACDSGASDNDINDLAKPEGYNHQRAKFLAENDELDETNWADFDLNTYNEIKYLNQSVVASVNAAITASALV